MLVGPVDLGPRFLVPAGQDLAGCFVYGSVAAGTATSSSDVDCFVLTSHALPAPRRALVDRRFIEVQRCLGFAPDLSYPIEVFSVERSWQALRSVRVQTMLDAAGRDQPISAEAAESDDVEVLRALVNTHLPIVPTEALEALMAEAGRIVLQAATAAGRQVSDITDALGVRHVRADLEFQSRSTTSMPSRESPRVSTFEVT